MGEHAEMALSQETKQSAGFTGGSLHHADPPVALPGTFCGHGVKPPRGCQPEHLSLMQKSLWIKRKINK